MDNNTNLNNNNQTVQGNTIDPILNQQTNNQTVEQINQQPIQQNTIGIELNTNNEQIQIQNQLQSIPTVEQNPEQFINNVQTQNQEKKEEKKEGVNFVFIIILFIVILVAIFFLFPLLLDYI